MTRTAAQSAWSCLLLTRLPWKAILFLIGLAALVAVSGGERSVYDWMPYDNFDKVDDMYRAITAQNCKSKPTSELRLPYGSVGQLPKFNRLLSYIVFPNRTKLLHVHNMALNRAFFFRYGDNLLLPSLLFTYYSSLWCRWLRDRKGIWPIKSVIAIPKSSPIGHLA